MSATNEEQNCLKGRYLNNSILENEVQAFIDLHLKDDVHKIAMSRSPFPNVSAQELAGQIAAKQRATKKLPTWYAAENIYYPPMLSMEQCSSEKTAAYKAGLITGNHVLDMTGGFGVDSLYFSKHAAKVTHCEIFPELSMIAAHNAQALNATNIVFLNVDGLEFLNSSDEQFSTIYIDPARRGKVGKVFMLKDCSPNVVEHLDLLLGKAKRIIIKTSPLLDISAAVKDLRNVTEVQIISLRNECKELLFILDSESTHEPYKITSITINEEIKKVSFYKKQSDDTTTSLITPGLASYLYEPDVALLKSGAFYEIGLKFKLQKLDLNSQLYTAETIDTTFPGRIFKIEEILTKKELKQYKDLHANVIVRNYPAKPEELIKAFKIRPSQNEFLIFTKTQEKGFVILKASILQHY